MQFTGIWEKSKCWYIFIGTKDRDGVILLWNLKNVCDVEKINVSWKLKGLHLPNKLIFLLRKEQRRVLFGKKKCILLRNDCVVVCSISLHITLVHTHKRTPKHNIRVLCSFGKGKYFLSFFFSPKCWRFIIKHEA